MSISHKNNFSKEFTFENLTAKVGLYCKVHIKIDGQPGLGTKECIGVVIKTVQDGTCHNYIINYADFIFDTSRFTTRKISLFLQGQNRLKCLNYITRRSLPMPVGNKIRFMIFIALPYKWKTEENLILPQDQKVGVQLFYFIKN